MIMTKDKNTKHEEYTKGKGAKELHNLSNIYFRVAPCNAVSYRTCLLQLNSG